MAEARTRMRGKTPDAAAGGASAGDELARLERKVRMQLGAERLRESPLGCLRRRPDRVLVIADMTENCGPGVEQSGQAGAEADAESSVAQGGLVDEERYLRPSQPPPRTATRDLMLLRARRTQLAARSVTGGSVAGPGPRSTVAVESGTPW